MTVRRAAAHVVLLAAALVVVITLARRCESRSAGGDIVVTVELDAVPEARTVHVELRSRQRVVAWVDRNAADGLRQPMVLRAPALGADGEVRISIETADGLRTVRKPLVAPAGSAVTIRPGDDE